MYQLLIVDDEPLVQAGIRSMLNWNEMNIEICGTAMNGQAALKIIEEKSTDIVITDIKMPVFARRIWKCTVRYCSMSWCYPTSSLSIAPRLTKQHETAWS